MRLALFQPDLAGNVGTLVRLGACLGVPVDVIEPCGFPFTDKAFKRAGMDYVAHADVTGHADWERFQAQRRGRLVLLTTKSSIPYAAVDYRPDDVLLVGQESAGVPDHVHAAADVRVVIPMRPGLRSLNVAIAAAMVLGEALRQTALFPDWE